MKSAGVLALLFSLLPAAAFAESFRQGDVVISQVSYACGPPGFYLSVDRYTPDGLFVRSVGNGIWSTGPASMVYEAESGTFAAVATTYYSEYAFTSLAVSINADGTTKPIFHPYALPWSNGPVAIAPDGSGGMYALWFVDYGFPNPQRVIELRRFDRWGVQTSGGSVPMRGAAFKTALTMDVGGDGCTVLYPMTTGSGKAVGRYDFCGRGDLAEIPVPDGTISSVRFLPDGGILVAYYSPARVLRLDAAGKLVREYRFPTDPGFGEVDAIALDPAGLSFYAVLSSSCYYIAWLVRVRIDNGVWVGGPSQIRGNAANSMAVAGEWRATSQPATPRRRAVR